MRWVSEDLRSHIFMVKLTQSPCWPLLPWSIRFHHQPQPSYLLGLLSRTNSENNITDLCFSTDLLSLSSVSPSRKLPPTPPPSVPSCFMCLISTSLLLCAFLDHRTYCIASWWAVSTSISLSCEFAKVRSKFQWPLILWCIIQYLAKGTQL